LRPPWRPTPAARIEDLSVRCLIMKNQQVECAILTERSKQPRAAKQFLLRRPAFDQNAGRPGRRRANSPV
jgi:hypothetical protein